jgi:hypothetical protein
LFVRLKQPLQAACPAHSVEPARNSQERIVRVRTCLRLSTYLQHHNKHSFFMRMRSCTQWLHVHSGARALWFLVLFMHALFHTPWTPPTWKERNTSLPAQSSQNCRRTWSEIKVSRNSSLTDWSLNVLTLEQQVGTLGPPPEELFPSAFWAIPSCKLSCRTKNPIYGLWL